jgi:hypothetical protein
LISSQTYENYITNNQTIKQNQLNLLKNIQRRENLIKLDLETAYMTRNDGIYDGSNSAGCSTESSPVDDHGKL